MRVASVVAILVAAAVSVDAFYLPGISPKDYEKDDDVALLVNALSAEYGGYPYDYYFPLFNFCKPEEGVKAQREGLGSILFGDRLYNGPFKISMLKEEKCAVLCKATYKQRAARFLQQRIYGNYQYNWLVDGLPAGSAVDYERYWDSPVGIEDTYAPGVPLGTVDFGPNGANMQLNTHFRFTIEYHETPDHKYRVVGVSVDPESKQTKLDASGQPDGCYDANASPLVIDDIPQDFEAVYTYSVHWVPSDVKWATRWDRYMAYPRTEIHWFSLTNSAIICTALVAVVNAILVRAVRKDIARYNEIDLGAEDIPNQSGWKLVSGDVFRAPRYRMLLSVFLGTGAHLLAMVGVTLFFTLLGFLSPANRGPLLTATIVLCTLFASVGGYVSALAYKTFGGEEWRLNLILTPTLVPGIVFAVFLVLNFLLVFVNSSGAVPFGTMLVLVFMWFTISIPLSAGGGLLALRTDAISVPVKTNQIPRQIPDQRFALRPIGSILIGGLLPFVAIVIELYFIFDSLWSHRIYFMFGFLFVCVGLAILAATTVTIITVYLMLCSENHLWAWQSFFIAGSCAFYVLGYSLIMLLLSLFRTSFVSACLYIGYSFLVSFLVFVLVGSVGYVATFFFLRRIYATVKID